MLLSAVSVLVVAQSSSEIPEGLMNNPAYCAVLNGTSAPSDVHVPLSSIDPFAHSYISFTHGCIYTIFPGYSGRRGPRFFLPSGYQLIMIFVIALGPFSRHGRTKFVAFGLSHPISYLAGSFLFIIYWIVFLSSIEILGPPQWSSGQSFWLQIQRSRVRFPALSV